MWHHDDMRIVSSLLVLAFSACIPPPPGGGGPGADGGIDDVDGGVDADGVDAVFTWQEVSGTVCANGTPAGFGLSAVDDGSDTLVIFFNGGGACWDNVSCFGVNAASHVSTTYTADVMRNDLAPLLASGLIDRNTDTPFANAHLAFIPYCTADLHAGRADRQYQADLLGLDIRTVHHRGKDNVVADVAALKARFPDVSRVLVMGASAGGFGAVLGMELQVFDPTGLGDGIATLAQGQVATARNGVLDHRQQWRQRLTQEDQAHRGAVFHHGKRDA